MLACDITARPSRIMERYFTLFSSFFTFAAYVACQGTITSMVIVPEVVHVIVQDGQRLHLECLVTFSGQLNSFPMFSKDGKEVKQSETRYEITYLDRRMPTFSRRTTTLSKNVTDVSDTGEYTCQVRSDLGNHQISVYVYVFSVTSTSATLTTDYARKVELQCTVNANVAFRYTYNISWERAGETLEENDKFSIHDNTLLIKNPRRPDTGVYQCVITFFPDSVIEKQTLRPNPSLLKAGPLIHYHDSEQILEVGAPLGLTCIILGFPLPEVTWYKDKEEVNLTSKIQTMSQNSTSTLTITAVDKEDQGVYTCMATNTVPPFNASAEIRVTITDSGKDPSSGAPSETPTLQHQLLLSFSMVFLTTISFDILKLVLGMSLGQRF